jgi:hypothetical protein
VIGRLDADPGWFALDGVVGPMRLFGVARRRDAVVDDQTGWHGWVEVAGGGGGVKLGVWGRGVGAG